MFTLYYDAVKDSATHYAVPLPNPVGNAWPTSFWETAFVQGIRTSLTLPCAQETNAGGYRDAEEFEWWESDKADNSDVCCLANEPKTASRVRRTRVRRVHMIWGDKEAPDILCTATLPQCNVCLYWSSPEMQNYSNYVLTRQETRELFKLNS